MKKSNYVFIIIFLLIIIGGIIYFNFSSNNTNNNNSNASRISTNINIESSNTQVEHETKAPKETVISTYSTRN